MPYDIRKVLKQHPCFTNAGDFSSLCEPLKALGISYFGHARVSADGQLAVFSTSPEYLEHHIRQSYYNFDSLMITPNAKEEYIIWDTVERRGPSKQLHDDFIQHGYAHTFNIIQQGAKYKDTYYFAAEVGYESINAQYLQYIGQLKKFILYFKNKVKKNKSLKLAYELTIQLDTKSGGYLTNNMLAISAQPTLNINDSEINRIYIPGKDVYLTLREMNCLHWIAQGKTGDEIAAILSITPRTVKAHIANAKEKLGCYNQFQLGMVYAEIKTL